MEPSTSPLPPPSSISLQADDTPKTGPYIKPLQLNRLRSYSITPRSTSSPRSLSPNKWKIVSPHSPKEEALRKILDSPTSSPRTPGSEAPSDSPPLYMPSPKIDGIVMEFITGFLADMPSLNDTLLEVDSYAFKTAQFIFKTKTSQADAIDFFLDIFTESKDLSGKMAARLELFKTAFSRTCDHLLKKRDENPSRLIALILNDTGTFLKILKNASLDERGKLYHIAQHLHTLRFSNLLSTFERLLLPASQIESIMAKEYKKSIERNVIDYLAIISLLTHKEWSVEPPPAITVDGVGMLYDVYKDKLCIEIYEGNDFKPLHYDMSHKDAGFQKFVLDLFHYLDKAHEHKNASALLSLAVFDLRGMPYKHILSGANDTLLTIIEKCEKITTEAEKICYWQTVLNTECPLFTVLLGLTAFPLIEIEETLKKSRPDLKILCAPDPHSPIQIQRKEKTIRCTRHFILEFSCYSSKPLKQKWCQTLLFKKETHSLQQMKLSIAQIESAPSVFYCNEIAEPLFKYFSAKKK